MNKGFRDDIDARRRPGDVRGNRGFGYTVGGIFMAIGAAKAWMAAALTAIASLFLGVGMLLVLLALAAPARLTLVHRLWLRLGSAIAEVMNPVILALLYLLVVTPTAMIMRLAGKRPLRLAPDPTTDSYWIARAKPDGEKTSMRQQF